MHVISNMNSTSPELSSCFFILAAFLYIPCISVVIDASKFPQMWLYTLWLLFLLALFGVHMRAARAKRQPVAPAGPSALVPAASPRPGVGPLPEAVHDAVADHAAGGAILRAQLLNRWVSGAFTCKDTCELSHYITCAGGVGVSDLAVNPNSAGDNHSRRSAYLQPPPRPQTHPNHTQLKQLYIVFDCAAPREW